LDGSALSETRKLAVILVADVVGYSRLAGAERNPDSKLTSVNDSGFISSVAAGCYFLPPKPLAKAGGFFRLAGYDPGRPYRRCREAATRRGLSVRPSSDQLWHCG